MRAIPAAVETLLKSRAQAGANAHNHLITLTGAPAGYQDWSTIRDIRYDYSTGGHFVERADGKLLVTYLRKDTNTGLFNVMLSVVDTEDDIFLSDNESMANESIFYADLVCDSSNHWASLYVRPDGKILLFIHRQGDTTGSELTQKVMCYISNNGLGTDFTLLSTVIESEPITSPANWNAAESGVWKAIMLPSGRLLLPHTGWHTGLGGPQNVSFVSYSDNNGASWTNVELYDGYYVKPAKGIAVFGTQIVVSTGYWSAGGHSWFFESNDEGETWAAVAEEVGGTDAWSGNLFYGEGDGYNYYINPELMPMGTTAIYRRLAANALPLTGQLPYDLTNTWELITPDTGIQGANFNNILWITAEDTIAVAGSLYDPGLPSTNTSAIFGGIKNVIQIRAKRIEVNRNKGMASSATVVFDNKGGIYSPDKAAGADWKNVMFPNNGILIDQGYGSELIRTFTGTIDDVVMTTFPAEITLTCRDYLKRAYDQLITSGGVHTITYANATPESMFTSLAGLAGWAAGDIHTEATGLTIDSKTFANETYGDAFSWLADLCGYYVWCDEDGDIYFYKDDDDAVPTSDYAFAEGEDIISLGYTISDRDLYNKIIVIGDGVSYELTYYNTYGILAQKKMIINASEATTEAQCQAIAEQARYVMNARARVCEFAAVANPYIQIKDTLTVTETTTLISELYNVTDISTVQSPDGYIAQITCYHYAAPAES